MIRAAIILILLTMTPSLQAVLLRYESFDYLVPGEQLAGKNGGDGFGGNAWTSGGTKYTIKSSSLSNGVQLTAGNSATMTGDAISGGQAGRVFDKIDGIAGTTTWISFLFVMNSTDPSGLALDDTAFMSFKPSETGASVSFGVFNDPDNANKLTLGIATVLGGSSAVTYSFSPILFQPSITYSMVASIDWKAGTAPETIKLFINPNQFSEPNPDSPDAEASLHIALNPTSSTQRLNRLSLNAGSKNTEWTFDEIRLGTEFADVMPIPEPKILFTSMFGAMLLWIRRGRLWEV